MKSYCSTVVISILAVSTALSDQPVPPATQELQAAAESGDAEAQYQLAGAHLRGQGVTKDPAKAFELTKAAADKGHADAIGGVGYFYSNGVVASKDQVQAAEWFRKGAEKGSARARLNLGIVILQGKIPTEGDPQKWREEGLQWIKLAADQEFPEAALAYANAFYFGDYGLEKDYHIATKYYKIAAQVGFEDAQNNLGIIFEHGMDGQIDIESARQWYRKAALQGNIKSQANLGRVLKTSEDPNIQIEALAWWLLASAQGELTSQRELAAIESDISEKDMKAARLKQQELCELIQK